MRGGQRGGSKRGSMHRKKIIIKKKDLHRSSGEGACRNRDLNKSDNKISATNVYNVGVGWGGGLY